MSLPAELRVLCQQLSSTSNTKLPQITSILLRNVLRCQGPLSSGASLATKSDSSESSILVHKLKTQISTFLQGKSIEARYTAAALIKGVVDVGGWEVLREADSWVRGLLIILGKPDPIATKKLCILSLTSIYLKVHQYQTLVREIATPTLPNFVLSCLNQLTSTSSGRDRDIAPLLRETVFESFSVLIQRYPTIFRPYNKQIRTEVRAYLAPTISDGHFITMSLGKSARRLAVLLYQSAAKNSSGEEWIRGIQDLVKKIHGTIDQVYRAVIEDWEPPNGYISQSINIDEEVHGGAKSGDDLPLWNGIDAGLERLVGLLDLLANHFRYQTVAAITIPLGSIVGLLTRLMSVVPPSNQKQNSAHDGMRLHPAVERGERERLWAGLSGVYVASMEVYLALAQRLHHNFTSMAQPCLSQVAWTFTHVLHDEDFRTAMYQLIFRILPLCGSSFQQSTVDLLSPIIKACCSDVRNVEDGNPLSKDETKKGSMSRPSVNVDTFFTNKTNKPVINMKRQSRIVDAAEKLHPLFLTHLPQQYLQGYLRAEIDRTSVLVHHKEAMLVSVLHPFTGKNGKVLPSIMPHLCREFSGTSAVESILRPRQPVVFPTQAPLQDQLSLNGVEMYEDVMEDVVVADTPSFNQSLSAVEGDINKEGVTVPRSHEATQILHTTASDEEDSDESVHLTMELSDSEDERLS